MWDGREGGLYGLGTCLDLLQESCRLKLFTKINLQLSSSHLVTSFIQVCFHTSFVNAALSPKTNALC